MASKPKAMATSTQLYGELFGVQQMSSLGNVHINLLKNLEEKGLEVEEN